MEHYVLEQPSLERSSMDKEDSKTNRKSFTLPSLGANLRDNWREGERKRSSRIKTNFWMTLTVVMGGGWEEILNWNLQERGQSIKGHKKVETKWYKPNRSNTMHWNWTTVEEWLSRGHWRWNTLGQSIQWGHGRSLGSLSGSPLPFLILGEGHCKKG